MKIKGKILLAFLNYCGSLIYLLRLENRVFMLLKLLKPSNYLLEQFSKRFWMWRHVNNEGGRLDFHVNSEKTIRLYKIVVEISFSKSYPNFFLK